MSTVIAPGELADALASVNRARRRDPSDPRRAVDLLEALERILAALPADRRDRTEGGGSSALAELDEVLRDAGVEEGAEGLRTYLAPLLEALVDALLDHPERRLAAYGTLRPGQPNHERVATLVGRWSSGETRGRLYERGWGAAAGFPGLVWDPAGESVPVQVLESAALPSHWDGLDEFEGPGYARILVPVEGPAGRRVCNLYALREDPSSPDPGS